MTLPRDIRDFKNKYGFANVPLDRRTKEYKNFVSDLGIRNERDFNNFLRKYIKANKPILDRKRFIELSKELPEKVNFKNLIDTNQSKKEYKKYLKRLFSKYSQINITNPKKYVLYSINGSDYRPLNDNNYINILGTIDLNEIEIKEIKVSGNFSDCESEMYYNINFIENLESIDFEIREKQEKRKKKEGALFPYFNNQIIDLKRYQIYRKDDVKEYEENCFIYAMRLLGLDNNSLEYIKSFIKSSHLSKTDVKKIAETLNITIEINEVRNDEGNKSRTTVYNKGMKENYKLCLFENHYFIYDDKTNYTSYSIINHKDIKHRNEWNYIYKSNNDKDKKRTINSLKLISLMIENKDYWFSLISFEDLDYKECMNAPKMPYYNGLHYDTNTATKEIIYTDKDKSSKFYDGYDLVYIDFETYKDNDNNHIPYVLCAYICDINGKLINTVNYTGIDCGLKLLNKLKNNAILYAHNAKYDYNFIIRYLTYIKSEIKSGGSFKELKGGYHNKKIVIRDTYSYINMKLDKMPKCFMTQEEQKGIKKEIIPYDLYNEERVKRRLIPVEEIRSFLDESKMNEMIKNAKEWNCYIEDGDKSEIEIVIYSIKYCMMDVKILYSCFNRFRETCIEKFEMDVINYITISSFVDAYFKKSGCYNGCFQLGLNVKEFVMKSIVGGRVMTSNNKKWLIKDKILNDFDAVSLYPSAMKRLEGFLLGTPKVLAKETDYNTLKNYNGYFVEIKIKSIGIKRDFPLSSYINENGVRDWNNEMEGKIIVVDKTTLEDLIEYQKIKFEIVRGYYFDSGFNTKITEIISYLFEMRKKLKKEGNPMEIVYKLMMNSAYGKTIQKDIEKKSVFFNDKEKKDVYVSRNYNIVNQIIEYEENKWRIEVIEASGLHYNACHIGSSILSMSKRIMNEVMTTAEDNGIKIYYQDTDSIHLEDKDIEKLKSVYEDKYKRTLIGKDLGQFHSDLEIKGAKDVYSTGLIALGKKTYLHIKEGEDENGNKINEYHVRMKGINESGIDYYCNSENIDKWELYMRLYKGEEVEFDLTAGGDKAIFKFDNKYNVRTLNEFKRKVHF